MQIVTIILTFNEEKHIARCIDSVRSFSSRVIIVDSYSTDQTVEIARELGAEIFVHKFSTQSNQFNWALSAVDLREGDFIVRVDADEYFDAEAIEYLNGGSFKSNAGLAFRRVIKYQESIVKFGGMRKKIITRGFKYGRGKSDTRLMDEHIYVDGTVVLSPGNLIDHNLNDHTFWVNKHHKYAEREALNLILDIQSSKYSIARWIYYKFLPGRIRPYIYFVYRFFILGGFRDDQTGRKFHYYQGLWYRTLVELKYTEMKKLNQKELGKIMVKYSET